MVKKIGFGVVIAIAIILFVVGFVTGLTFYKDNPKLAPKDSADRVAPYGLPDFIMEGTTITVEKNSSMSLNGTMGTLYWYSIPQISTFRSIGTGYARIMSSGFFIYDSDGNLVSAIGGTGQFPPPGFPPGTSFNVRGSTNGYFLPGDYVLIARADPENLVEESNESNNEEQVAFILP
ncbi:MAG: hypothetical protein IIA87_00350 [Nanoarchaeota archaeon]|nr:hypothetical protein [Nanoarchaeota archaeon]